MLSDNEPNRIILKWTELAGATNVEEVEGCQLKMFYNMAGDYTHHELVFGFENPISYEL
ncbi:MAG: hypothetical protein GY941_21150 [Planctomycetes bacterium]|nr:hypothetical protein [Planctomycetota bacterium]